MGKAKSKKRAEKPVEPESGEPSSEQADAQKGVSTPTPEPVEADRERLVRLQADFENYKKRTIRERNETYRRANEDIMEELLPVLDHMELALEAASTHEADEAIVEGFRLVSQQLRNALGKFGLVAVDADGSEFDHHLHEAISHLPSADVPENHVIAMTRRGYKLGERLLRAAQVVVSSGAPETTSEVAEETAEEIED